jgi:beta-galactosidase/beta-glucuronidase
MGQPHVIRLRGPWELQPLERDVPAGDGMQHAAAPLPSSCRVTVPGDWRESLGGDFCGRARYQRRFNRPTNLTADQRVWLVLEAVDYQADVAINGHALGTMRDSQPARFDITATLEPSNLLTVDVSLPAAVFADPTLRRDRAGQPGGLIGEVRLEIIAN